jgi:hypothetical protein
VTPFAVITFPKTLVLFARGQVLLEKIRVEVDGETDPFG